MKFSSGVASVVALALVLSACGQKGPLVLPDAQKRKRSVPTLPATGRPAESPGAPASEPPKQPPAP